MEYERHNRQSVATILIAVALILVGLLYTSIAGGIWPEQVTPARVEVPTLQPTPPLAVPTVYTAQPQVSNENGTVTITNNYTYVNAPVDVCIALICE